MQNYLGVRILILFFDSNVIIGYVFKGDIWHAHANNILNCPNKKYYSDNVLKETKYKIKKISRRIFDGLLFLSSELLKDKSIEDNLTLDDVLRFVKRKRLKILENYIRIFFSEKYSFEVNKDELSKELKVEANKFMYEYAKNFKFVQINLKKHDRKHLYSNLKQKLLKIDKDFHIEDVIIILDAHDLCNINNQLILITADSKEIRNELICKNTKINDVKDLREFFINKCP